MGGGDSGDGDAPGTTGRRARAGLDHLAVLRALLRYWLTIRPRVGRELRRWQRRAERIPDPVLREQALANLRTEALNPEAAAVFATLVPLTQTGRATRLLARLQVICDYADTVGEQPAADPFANNLALQEALTAAIDPAAPPTDRYRHNARRDDGGYLDALLAACREDVERLPSIAAVRPAALRAARRCGEAQAHTHAAIHRGEADGLAEWARRQDRADGYRWWEVAAGGISTISLYALLAAAARPDATAAEAERIDAAYFPPLCALSALLDSLVDNEGDSRVPAHSSFGHYADASQAAERLATIAGAAGTEARALRGGRAHAAIVAGMAALYLSAPSADSPATRPAREAILARVGPVVTPIMATMRLRRRLAR